MKNLLVTALALILLIPLARTVFAAPAAKVDPAVEPSQMRSLSLKGTIQSTEIYSNVPPNIFATATGTGDATQIGRFAVSYRIEMDLLDLSTTETAYFVTPSGDSFQAKAVGQASQDKTTGMYNMIQIYTITGGTGQFEGASGTLTLKRLFNMTNGITASTFEGTILVP